jgi:hypothetical protein
VCRLPTGVLSLVHSLVHQVESSGSEARFNMLEMLREYALEQLAASGDEVQTKRAHAAYCIVLAEEGNAWLSGAARAAWLSRCDVEHDNFRAALDWLTGTGNTEWALRLGLALFGFWERREHLAEGRQRLEAVLHGSVAPIAGRARDVVRCSALALPRRSRYCSAAASGGARSIQPSGRFVGDCAVIDRPRPHLV